MQVWHQVLWLAMGHELGCRLRMHAWAGLLRHCAGPSMGASRSMGHTQMHVVLQQRGSWGHAGGGSPLSRV
jgi:hypothetical protein